MSEKEFGDEAIERAARVIFKIAAEFAYEEDYWDQMDSETKSIWLNDARAVIAALKDLR